MLSRRPRRAGSPADAAIAAQLRKFRRFIAFTHQEVFFQDRHARWIWIRREGCLAACSCQNRSHDFAGNVGQAEVAALVAVGEPLVVDAQQVQHRGVQVVDVDEVVDGVVAELVGRAVGDARLECRRRPATSRSRGCGGRGRRLPLLPWAIGVRPNSPPQMTSVSSSMPRCFRSVISAAVARSTVAAADFM